MSGHITDLFAQREAFYHIVLRLRRERALQWRDAFRQCADADKKVNRRILFKTYLAFKEWRLRYEKSSAMEHQNADSRTDSHFLQDFQGIGEERYLSELFFYDEMHVNQTNGSGKDWIDIEEELHERRVYAQIEQMKRSPRKRHKKRRSRASNNSVS